MPMVASGLVHQDEVQRRVERVGALFARDPNIVRIEHRIAPDWSGDYSIFVDVILRQATPPASVVAQISDRIGAALLQVLRSEELGMHAYLNLVSRPSNGR